MQQIRGSGDAVDVAVDVVVVAVAAGAVDDVVLLVGRDGTHYYFHRMLN